MAKQRNIRFKGTIGNIIYYESGGEWYMRNKPPKVKQTRASRASAGKFGTANHLSGSLRDSLEPLLPDPCNRRMMWRFTDALYHWLLRYPSLKSIPPAAALPFVSGFQLNEHTSIGQRWKIPVSVQQPGNNRIQVKLPAFIPVKSIRAPADTVAVTCIIMAAGSRFDGTPTGNCTAVLEIPYTGQPLPEQSVILKLPTPRGTVMATVMALRYRLKSGRYSSRASYLPASVIDARYY